MGEKNYLLAEILQKMTFDPINIQKFWSSFRFRCECVKEKCNTVSKQIYPVEAKWWDLFQTPAGICYRSKVRVSRNHRAANQLSSVCQRHRSSVTWSSFQKRCVTACLKARLKELSTAWHKLRKGLPIQAEGQECLLDWQWMKKDEGGKKSSRNVDVKNSMKMAINSNTERF